MTNLNVETLEELRSMVSSNNFEAELLLKIALNLLADMEQQLDQNQKLLDRWKVVHGNLKIGF